MHNPYQVLGTSIPVRRAREREFAEILSRIDGNHLMVVAPRFYGKSVLLRDLVNHAEIAQRFGQRIFWDLTRHTPTTDQAFWEQFAEQLMSQLTSESTFFVELLAKSPPVYETIVDVFSALQAENVNVLLVLDGMDEILVPEAVSRNVLDNLRDLGELGNLKFITGSRKTIRELSPASLRPSPFLNIFHMQPIRLAAISEKDWAAFLAPFQDHQITFDSGALGELKNWTGGVPLLVAALCREIWAYRSGGPAVITKTEIDACAAACEESELLVRLWNDCEAVHRADLTDLVRRGSLQLSDIPDGRLQELTRRGYVVSSRSGVRSSCKLMERFICNCSDAVPDIKRLFGAKTAFLENIQVLLELRLNQIPPFDSDLFDHIERAVRELQKPNICITQLRSVADRAVHLIIMAETDGGRIRSEWVRSWTGDPGKNRFQTTNGQFPTERGKQMAILDAATDDRNAAPLRRLTRSIFLLLLQVHNTGNLGQHLNGAARGTIDVSFMAAQCFAAIELAEQLSAALKTA